MQRGKISFGKIQLNVNKTPAETTQESQDAGGFKKMDKQQMIRQIEDVAEDLESQHLKDLMGISSFGRKAAKVFDINEQIAKARTA
ncbi:hypothetical protein AWZ03_015390, partial [Drosophila navojoa]